MKLVEEKFTDMNTTDTSSAVSINWRPIAECAQQTNNDTTNTEHYMTKSLTTIVGNINVAGSIEVHDTIAFVRVNRSCKRVEAKQTKNRGKRHNHQK